jgi:hypothetical protein
MKNAPTTKKLAIFGLLILLAANAFSQIPSDANLHILIKNLSETNVSLIVSNTKEDVMYEVQIKQSKTNWVSLGFEYGSEITNCMSFVSWFPREFSTNSHIPITAKSIRVRSWIDSYQMGIPDWWQIKYFGDVGIDSMGTPMGDGWYNMFKYQKGMNPFKWYPPPAPQSEFPYSIPAHYPEPPPFAELSEVTAAAISKTILSVTAKEQTNGYELTVLHPIAHARYLLLVRDKNDQQWRASGYFVSGTNRNAVYLHADKKGMMTNAQSPIALPTVKFLPDVVQPEFTAGWGEDSDGDGLPDIYEVLVTHTKPDDADTGDTGIPDGYRVFSDDGWNNWDKFRYRTNPFKKCEPPPAIVLTKPTITELREAYSLKTDLPYELRQEFRTNTATGFQPYSLWVDSNYVNPDNTGHVRCDVRVSWKVPPARP